MKKYMKSISRSVTLIFTLVLLAACGQNAVKPSVPKAEPAVPALFTADDLKAATSTVISSVTEIQTRDLNNAEINIEGQAAPEEDANLTSQAVLTGASGYLVYYRTNAAGDYEIWMANQSDDSKTKIWSGSSATAVQSVAVDGRGEWVAASIMNPATSSYDVYLFEVGPIVSKINLLASSNKDETDVSMTADGRTIVYSKPTNAGLSKINLCDYNPVADSCTVTVLGATDNQRQASISASGRGIALIRDIGTPATPRWRVLLYDTKLATYTTITTRYEELSHPSITDDGKNVMFLRDRTTAIGKYLVRIKDLDTNIIDNELSKADLGHPHISGGLDFFTYRDEASSGFTRAFTREIPTNLRASAHAGSWDYFQPYWQQTMPQLPNNVIVVDKDATGTNDGTTWENAYTSLQDALECVGNGTTQTHCDDRTFDNGYNEIWVASGTYYADEGINESNNDESASFTINNDGVQVYGGFDGVAAGGTGGTQETLREERNYLTNRVILSGDIEQNDTTTVVGDNSTHVVRMPNNFEALSADTVLDGVEITAGNADSAGNGAYGGGLLCDAPIVNRYCEVSLYNLYFHNNTANNPANIDGKGGAIYFESARPHLYNLKFFDNYARFGGAMYLEDSQLGYSTQDANRLGFYSNEAIVSGGAIQSENSSGTLLNSLFSKNFAFNAGGAAYIDGNKAGINARWNFYNNTFHDNDTNINGGAINFQTTGETGRVIAIANSMFTNNNAGINGNDLFTNMDDAAAEAYFDTNRSNTGDVFDAGAGSTTIVNNFSGAAGAVSYVDVNGADNILGNLDDDYTLTSGSVGIDDGKGNVGAGTEDYLGNNRNADGDGNGTEIRDIGAYERQ